MDYIWIILLILLGLVMLLKPDILWKIENIFTVKNGEPADLYLALTRFGGIFGEQCGGVLPALRKTY